MTELYKVKYRHLGWHGQGQDHKGVVTVSAEKQPGQMVVGLSFCAPGENFCRKLGRDTADDRRTKFPITIKDSGTAVIDLLCQINFNAGMIYDFKPHGPGKRAMPWLTDFLMENFPFLAALNQERMDCRI